MEMADRQARQKHFERPLTVENLQMLTEATKAGTKLGATKVADGPEFVRGETNGQAKQ